MTGPKLPDDEWVSWIDMETIPNEGDPWLPWFVAIVLAILLVALACVLIVAVTG